MKNENINFRLILEGCLHENEQSQRKLYEYFHTYGINVALLYVTNLSEAKEIYNESLFKVFQNLDKYDPAYPFQPWLKTIIINTAIDFYRKQKKHAKVFTSNIPYHIVDNNDIPLVDPDEDFLPILQDLSPAYRMVFNLYVIEEYKHHEIAKILNISVGTSKSNLARAKTKLKELWLKKKGANYKLDQHG